MSCGGALDDDPPATPPPPPPPLAVEPQQAPEPYTDGAPATGAPADPAPQGPPSAPPPAAPPAPAAENAAPLVYTYPTGQWVYTVGHGWIWVPSGTSTADVEGVPYAYLYTPGSGWTWYLSPWGWGPYHYGGWYRHPWHPVGWHQHWVAHPRVVVRLGPGRYHRRW
jgi:hypothetical protein